MPAAKSSRPKERILKPKEMKMKRERMGGARPAFDIKSEAGLRWSRQTAHPFQRHERQGANGHMIQRSIGPTKIRSDRPIETASACPALRSLRSSAPSFIQSIMVSCFAIGSSRPLARKIVLLGDGACGKTSLLNV